MHWDVSLRIDSRPETLRVARRLIHKMAILAGASDFEASEIEVSAGEALTNAHRHAYPHGVGPVEIEVQAANSDFRVTVHDDGKEVTAPTVPRQLPEGRYSDGRGLYLISRLMDHLDIGIDGQGHGVILRMMRHLRGDPR